MKEQAQEQQFEDNQEPSEDFLQAAASLNEAAAELEADDSEAEGLDDEQESAPRSAAGKAKVTELRRRIEERLEEKRIALEYDYFELEERLEGLQ